MTNQQFLIDVPELKPARLKKPRLGRYEGVMRKFENSTTDLAKVFVKFNDQPAKSNGFRFIDLFCGAGGMMCGFSNASYTPIAAVEIVEIACDTHHHNFPDCKLHRGPIQDFHPKEALADIGEIQLVVGGPPCQGFSVAGFRNPDDQRNQLFREHIFIHL